MELILETVKLSYKEISQIVAMFYYGADEEFDDIDSLIDYLEEEKGYIEINR